MSLTANSCGQVLGGVADTVAQLITAYKSRPRPRRRDTDSGEDFVSIEIPDLDKEKPPVMGELGYAKNAATAFDFERLTRFMSYGFFMAPIQFQWFKFLSRAFPTTKANPTIPALKRVAVDQLMFAPFGKTYFKHTYTKEKKRDIQVTQLLTWGAVCQAWFVFSRS